MKIAVITFHFPNNVGALLQCMALQIKLNKMGHESSVIDYRPQYLVDMYKPLRNPFLAAYKHVKNYNRGSWLLGIYKFIRHIVSVSLSNLDYKNTRLRTKNTNEFLKKNICLTDRYSNIEELCAKPPSADIYVCGSDQIWNSDITNGNIDRAYYLFFGEKHIKRIAYGVSADIKEWQFSEVLQLLDRFDSISVREYETKEQLKKSGEIDSNVVPDPTLLLTREDYKVYEANIDETGYILFYGLKTKDKKLLLKALNEATNKLGLNVIDISPCEWKINAYKRVPVLGPSDFLGYISKASYIVTNSFHGTMFSLIYHKKFWGVLPSLKGSRISGLLHEIELEDRLISSDRLSKNVEWKQEIDYSIVEIKLEELRKKGDVFLEENLK